MKFSENFNIFSIILMSSFYFNKDFHLRISFNLNIINYKITRIRIKAKKINDIIVKIKKLLIFNY